MRTVLWVGDVSVPVENEMVARALRREIESEKPRIYLETVAGSPGPSRQAMGIDLCDTFAAAALTALMGVSDWRVSPREAAQLAYQHADAMLAERAKR